MRWIIFILIYTIIELYAFQAFRVVSKNKWVMTAYIIWSISVLSYLIYVMYTYDRSIGPTQYSLNAGALFVISIVPKLILIVFLFGEDIVRGLIGGYNYISQTFFNGEKDGYIPSRRKFLSQLALGAAAIPFAGFLHGIFKGKYNFKVLRHVLYFEDLPKAFDGFRIAQISDIHSGSFDDPEKIKYAVDLINEQEKDVLLFTGDIVNTKAEEMDPWIDIFKGIKSPEHGKFSVLGNHDYGEYVSWESEEAKEANFSAIKGIHDKIDFKLLLNEHTYLQKGEERIALLGVENWGHNFKKAGDLQLASQQVNKEDFKVLMTHDPSHWEHEVKNDVNNYHLTLSGHTHGFQFGIEIPGFLKWSPVQYVYKQWAGMYSENDRYINVNRGFGFHAYPGRVGIWPEITIIELRHGSKPV